MIFAFIGFCLCRYTRDEVYELANLTRGERTKRIAEKMKEEQKIKKEYIPFEISQNNLNAVMEKNSRYTEILEAVKGQDCMVFYPNPKESLTLVLEPRDGIDFEVLKIVDYNGVEITEEERKCEIAHECSCKTIRRKDDKIVITYDTDIVCMPKVRLVRK